MDYSAPYKTPTAIERDIALSVFSTFKKERGTAKSFLNSEYVGTQPVTERMTIGIELLTISSGKDTVIRDLSLIRRRTCYAYYNKHGIDRIP